MRDGDRFLSELAAAAALHWGEPEGPPKPVHRRENAVFRVRYADGRDTALRLHRPGYQSADTVEAELRLMESLADAAFACPWPQRTRDGALLAVAPDGRLASVVQWIDGAPIGAGGMPPGGNVAEGQALFHALGALVADLHLTADAVAPAELNRQAWDAEALCGADPLWGRFWENPALTPAEADLLAIARSRALKELAALPAAAQGLIHADLLQENVLSRQGALYLIDFDDCGYGPRAYDLATALIQHVESPVYRELRRALLEGYAAAGGPLETAGLGGLELFVMLRAMASAGWIMTRATPVDPRQRAYAARAVACARAFLDG